MIRRGLANREMANQQDIRPREHHRGRGGANLYSPNGENHAVSSF